jgi:hypothetical protein
LPLYIVGSPSSGWNELLSNPMSREYRIIKNIQ